MMSGNQKPSEIITPHEHDVLSGRGNFVNYHAGNEHFRALVRKHKLEYVRCPKPQKGKFSKMIVDEIKARDPPGRFLKQDAQTKLWYDIGEKKALDKTRQALREGAPEIMKEMSGDSGDESDDDNPRIAVQKDMMNRRGSAPPSFTGDMPLHQFMGSSGLQSPQMTRNGLLASPRLGSPGIISPGLLLGQLSPDMGQFSGRTPLGRMGRMVDPSALPGPPLQTQFDSLSQITAQQQAAMMMNSQMGNSFGSNMGQGLMSPQQIQLQNQMNAQQVAMNQLSQQLQQQQHQQQNQADFAELQMLQNKLQNLQRQSMANSNMGNPINMVTQSMHVGSMNSGNMNSGNMNSGHMFQSSHTAQFDPRSIDTMPPPAPVQSDTPRHRNSGQADYQVPMRQPDQHKPVRVDTLPGHNPRRMPPPSLIKREDSIKMDKLFGAASPQSTKRKVDGNGSSAHLSAMSLSIGDMNEEGNLSSVFDSSLRISGADKSGGDLHHPAREKLKERSSNGNNWDPNNLEMSVNTIGTGTGSEMRLSEAANMSYATFGDPNLHESDGNMSFGKVFEDPDRD